LGKLAQTYLHLKVRTSEPQLADTRAYFEYVGAISAQDHFKRQIELEIRIEEGSLRVWLTVIGSLYAGISAYGSFRAGIDYMVQDARKFSEYIIERVKGDIDMPPGALFRSERRLGLPGQIQRLYPQLEETVELIEKGHDIPARQLQDLVRQQIQHIASELDEPEEKKILHALEESLPELVRKRLPLPVRPIPESMHVARVLVFTNDERVSRAKPKDLLQRHPRQPKPPKFR
jgi:hypothetical protein